MNSFQKEDAHGLGKNDDREGSNGRAYLGIFRGAALALVIAAGIWLIVWVVLALAWE